MAKMPKAFLKNIKRKKSAAKGKGKKPKGNPFANKRRY